MTGCRILCDVPSSMRRACARILAMAVPPKTSIFDEAPENYDAWYDRFRAAYESELEVLRTLLPRAGRGLEVGVGTGRFAAPLGVQFGLDPSRAMIEVARRRGIDVSIGIAEELPFGDGSFDVVLMVATVCFLQNVAVALRETYRVIRSGGCAVVGMLDVFNPVGRRYRARVGRKSFFRDAVFISVDEVVSHLSSGGFDVCDFRQTLFREPERMSGSDEVRNGHGDGLFVAIRAMKPVARG
jgi:SAM-dependent methyltransferase